jgi:hypothetical protein
LAAFLLKQLPLEAIMTRLQFSVVGLLSIFAVLQVPAFAQERSRPYFVTYDHYLEEVDSLEISAVSVLGRDDDINRFFGNFAEFEYGARRWWTTALYVDWQHTHHQGSVFTGFRFENRFRLFQEERRINPVIYIEYEHLNEADKTLKEIIGFDGKADLNVPNSEAREEHEHELEAKLILSSEIGQWNISENFIGEKNLNEGRWEFGYAVGVSRPLGAASGKRCTFCAERVTAGVEVYGGLGEWGDFTTRGTSQYVAPVITWRLPSETVLRFSPGWGLTNDSVRTIFRFGVSQEVDNVASWIGKAFRGL